MNEQLRPYLAKFPVKDRRAIKKANDAGLFSERNVIMMDTTAGILKDVNKQYKKTFGKTFIEAILIKRMKRIL